MRRVDLVLRVVNGVLVAVIANSISTPNSCIFHISKTGLGGVVFTPPVGYNRPPSAVNDLSVTKQNEFVTAIRLRFSPNSAITPDTVLWKELPCLVNRACIRKECGLVGKCHLEVRPSVADARRVFSMWFRAATGTHGERAFERKK